MQRKFELGSTLSDFPSVRWREVECRVVVGMYLETLMIRSLVTLDNQLGISSGTRLV